MMIAKTLHKKTSAIPFAAGILAISSFFSLILGLLRNNLLSTSFTREQTDIFFAAFRVPDLVYGILITGGITAAFLPVFSSYAKQSKKSALALANNVLCVFFLALAVVSLLLAFLSPFFVKYLVPGFSPSQQALTLQLMQIMFLSPVLLGISAIFSAVLQYYHLFFAYALSPIFYNLGIIFGILFFYPLMGIKGLAWGVILGAVMHLAIQLAPAVRAGFKPGFSFSIASPGLRKIFKLMLPRAIGSGAYHINLIIITSLASIVSAGAISVFNYSNYIYGVPISLIGISFATAVFPALSKSFIEKKNNDFINSFNKTFRHIVFFALPAGFLFFILRAQIVRVIFGSSISGENYFSWLATRLTSASVGVLSLSLFAGCLIPFLARVFFSFHDTKTPVKIAVISMALNVALAYTFVWLLGSNNFFQKTILWFLKLSPNDTPGVIGLVLSIALSSVFQFFYLLFALKNKVKQIAFRPLLSFALKIFLACLVMSCVSWLSLRVFDLYFKTETVSGILSQGILSGLVGVAFYVLAVILLDINEIKKILALARRMLTKRP